jgi:hypothetical protein
MGTLITNARGKTIPVVFSAPSIQKYKELAWRRTIRVYVYKLRHPGEGNNIILVEELHLASDFPN